MGGEERGARRGGGPLWGGGGGHPRSAGMPEATEDATSLCVAKGFQGPRSNRRQSGQSWMDGDKAVLASPGMPLGLRFHGFPIHFRVCPNKQPA